MTLVELIVDPGTIHEPLQTKRFLRSMKNQSNFDSNVGDFSRSTPLSYAYSDIFLSILWNGLLFILAPSVLVFFPALITGVAAIIVDYVWFYRNDRRVVVLDGKPVSRGFICWWLVFWFEFLIAWNIGSFVGFTLLYGLFSYQGLVVAFLFCGWFWVATPLLSRGLFDYGIGTSVVTTTRKVGRQLSLNRFIWVLVLYAILLVSVFDWQINKVGELFLIGVIAASAMEIPLYLLRIRPGKDAWKALIVNSLVEWNYAVPIFFIGFWYFGYL